MSIRYKLLKFVSKTSGKIILFGSISLGGSAVIVGTIVPLWQQGYFDQKLSLIPQLKLSKWTEDVFVSKDFSVAYQLLNFNIKIGLSQTPAEINSFNKFFDIDVWLKEVQKIDPLVTQLSDIVVSIDAKSFSNFDNTTRLNINISLKPGFTWAEYILGSPNQESKNSVTNIGNSKLKINLNGFNAPLVYAIDQTKPFFNQTILNDKFMKWKKISGNENKLLNEFLESSKTGSDWNDKLGFVDYVKDLSLFDVNTLEKYNIWKNSLITANDIKINLWDIINRDAIKVTNVNQQELYSDWKPVTDQDLFYFYNSLNLYSWSDSVSDQTFIKFEFDEVYRGGLFEFIPTKFITDNNLENKNPSNVQFSTSKIHLEILWKSPTLNFETTEKKVN